MVKKMARKFSSVAGKSVARPVAAKGAKPSRSAAKTPDRKVAKPVKLLSGGNPQIAKGYGEAPVRAFIAAMPDWKQEVGRRLDELIVKAVPKVLKAVKWNTPLYGNEEGKWFLGFHCIAKYVKVAFFKGAALRPLPPVESTRKIVRYLHIYEGDEFDEEQFTKWVKQASKLPGEKM